MVLLGLFFNTKAAKSVHKIFRIASQARNDDTRCRHCEERSNPENTEYQCVAKFVTGRDEAIRNYCISMHCKTCHW